MKKLLMILLVVGVVFLSGCTGEGGGGAPSIKISNFGPLTVGASADKSVRSGGRVVVSALFSNEGGAPVAEEDEGKATLLGLGDDWHFDSDTPRSQNQELKIGQQKRLKWKIDAPTSSGYEIDITYPIEVRYGFRYGTVYMALFSWIKEDNYNNLLDSGDQKYIDEVLSSKGLVIQESSIGPVSIRLEEYEIVGENDGSDLEVVVKITNEGGGYLTNNKLNVVKRLGLISCDEEGFTAGGEVELIDNEFETYCKIAPTIDGGSPTDEIPTDITIEIKYNYYVSEKSSIYYHDRGK